MPAWAEGTAGTTAMAASTQSGRGRGGIVGINITPMVDVVLCLLVFFMAATRLYDWDENEFVVSVPQVAEAGPLTAAPDDLTLTVVRPGLVAVGRDSYMDAIPSSVTSSGRWSDTRVSITRAPVHRTVPVRNR